MKLLLLFFSLFYTFSISSMDIFYEQDLDKDPTSILFEALLLPYKQQVTIVPLLLAKGADVIQVILQHRKQKNDIEESFHLLEKYGLYKCNDHDMKLSKSTIDDYFYVLYSQSNKNWCYSRPSCHQVFENSLYNARCYFLYQKLNKTFDRHKRTTVYKGTRYLYAPNHTGLYEYLINEDWLDKDKSNKKLKKYLQLEDLFLAITNKDNQTVSYLIHAGPLSALNVGKIASLKWFGTTPLKSACIFRNYEAIRRLLEHDFNLFKNSKECDTTIFEWADEESMIEECYRLVRDNDWRECKKALNKGLFKHFIRAIENNDKEKARLLVNTTLCKMHDICGNNALHIIAKQKGDHDDLVKLYIQAITFNVIGSSCIRARKNLLNCSNDYGETPLFNAVNASNFKCVYMLLKAGVDVKNDITILGNRQCLLDSPVLHEKTDIVRVLLEYGVCVPKKYHKLAEKGWLTPHGNRVRYCNGEISTLLTQAYRKQAIKKFVHNTLHFPTQHHKTKLITARLSSEI